MNKESNKCAFMSNNQYENYIMFKNKSQVHW